MNCVDVSVDMSDVLDVLLGLSSLAIAESDCYVEACSMMHWDIG